MNYKRHYEILIARGRNRALEGYGEWHHIVPKCMGGGNYPENLVHLTAEEHFVAHQLLSKIYPDNSKIVIAAAAMATRATNNKRYSWIMKRQSQLLRGNNYSKGVKHGPMSAERRAHLSAMQKGRKFSEEHKAAIAATKASRTYVVSDEARAKMSSSRLGKKRGPCSPETRKKIGEANKGKIRTEETIAKLSAASKGRKRTPEWIANWRASMKKRERPAVIE